MTALIVGIGITFCLVFAAVMTLSMWADGDFDSPGVDQDAPEGGWS